MKTAFLSFLALTLLITESQPSDVFIQYDALVSSIRQPAKLGYTEVSISTNQKAQINFLDNTGSALIKVYQDSTLTLTGKYWSDNIQHRLETKVYDLEGNGTGVEINTFYKPLRDSVWNYYTLSGALLRRETYKRGNLVGVICF